MTWRYVLWGRELSTTMSVTFAPSQTSWDDRPSPPPAEDVRRFQVHQRETGAGAPTINNAVSALRFLFTVTLDRPDLSRRLVLVRHPRKLPDVLSVEEVGRLLEAAPGIKYRAALGAAYGAGLRVSEVAHLKIDDIDSKLRRGDQDENAPSNRMRIARGCGGAGRSPEPT